MKLGKGTRRELKLAIRAMRVAQSRLQNSRCGLRGERDAGGLVESVWADRLRMLGNGVVPAQAAEAWRFLEERLK